MIKHKNKKKRPIPPSVKKLRRIGIMREEIATIKRIGNRYTREEYQNIKYERDNETGIIRSVSLLVSKHYNIHVIIDSFLITLTIIGTHLNTKQEHILYQNQYTSYKQAIKDARIQLKKMRASVV